jgi:hypothetical protein
LHFRSDLVAVALKRGNAASELVMINNRMKK